MNFLAHGLRYLEEPYVLAGTAVPDWLNYVDRKIRARRRQAEPFRHDVDPTVAQVARGIVQHHRDDDAFHRNRIFAELSWQFALELRDRLPRDDSLRPSFLGHILVELLLDAYFSQTRPGSVDAYYAAVRSVSADIIQAIVNRITRRPTTRLAPLIPRFVKEGFLYDYATDDKLLIRLNQVLGRVRLEPLPDSLTGFLADARGRVYERAVALARAVELDGIDRPR